MKKLRGQITAGAVGWIFALACMALPMLAAEETSADPVSSPVGTTFKWLNFALVAGGLAYVVTKFGRPYFRGRAQSISQDIREAAEAQAAAERAVSEASEQLAHLQAEVAGLRQAALRESAAEAERIRALARSDAEKIAKAAHAEIEAAERVGRQELRTIAARLATERAAVLLNQRMNASTRSDFFSSFVGELQRSAP